MRVSFVVWILSLSLFAAIDINNASQKELMSLKRVGVKKAKAIIEYRKNHCFHKIEDLAKVKGIGKKIIDINRDILKVGECQNMKERKK